MTHWTVEFPNHQDHTELETSVYEMETHHEQLQHVCMGFNVCQHYWLPSISRLVFIDLIVHESLRFVNFSRASKEQRELIWTTAVDGLGCDFGLC